jgi:hypothetical protein
MITKPTTYTPEFIEVELNSIYNDILANEEVITLQQIIRTKPYSLQRISEWANTNEQISETYKKIKNELEFRLNHGGLKNNLNATMVIFNLKNNYGWKDKQEQDIVSRNETSVIDLDSLINYTDDDLALARDRIRKLRESNNQTTSEE